MANSGYFEKIFSYWSELVKKTESSDWYQRLGSGELKLHHYKGYLLETYHNTGFNPQIQGFAQFFLSANLRSTITKYLKHASSEVGHDLMALADLKVLGEDEVFIKSTKPLPITLAFNSYPVAQLLKGNPFAHLGYMFHLEFLPTQRGAFLADRLKKMGIPSQAMTFLEEHITVDIAHNKFLQEYIKELVQNDQHFEAVKQGIEVSLDLHTKMVGESIARGETLFSNSALDLRKAS